MVSWKYIPREIMPDIRYIRKFTKEHNKEASITVCKKPDRKLLFTSSSSRGQHGQTDAGPCDLQFGKSQRIADIHTHPVDADTLGVVPSPSDMTSTLYDSNHEGRPLVSCVTNHISPLMECYESKHLPDRTKLNDYNRALNRFSITNDAAFFIDNAEKDFSFAFYDSDTGKLIKKPNPVEVVKSAFGASTKFYKQHLNELERPGVCQFIQSFTVPHDDRVARHCTAELRKRDILGTIREKLT